MRRGAAPGVVDGAYFYDSALYVRKGDSSLIFKASSPEDFTPQKIQEIATAIAKVLASHMQGLYGGRA